MFCRSIFEYSCRISPRIPAPQTSSLRHSKYSRPPRPHFSTSASFPLRPSTFNLQSALPIPFVSATYTCPPAKPFRYIFLRKQGEGGTPIMVNQHSLHLTPQAPLLTPCVFNTYSHLIANHLYNQHLRVPRGGGSPQLFNRKSRLLFFLARRKQ